MDKLLKKVRDAIDSYYSESEKYGTDYAASNLLAFLEMISDYNPNP